MKRPTEMFCLMLIGFLLGSCIPLRAQKAPRITGTYSNMSYIAEAGDVVGYEIKIVFTGERHQGVMQIAEGVPGELIVVDIEASGSKISFSIPDNNPYAGKFTGTVENGWLRGEFNFKTGTKESVALRKGKSYWD